MSGHPTAMVIGAAGFIGGAVARALAGEYHVVAAGRGTDRPDLTCAALPELQPSLIVYCAGGSAVGRSIEAPLEDFHKTVPPLAEMLELMRTRAPSARLVLLSSAAVYGHAAQLPTPEDAPLAPVSPYGRHKQMCEELCRGWSAAYGLQTAAVRLFSVYGPGLRKQLLWDACRRARRGERKFQGTGEESRDWLHIDDAVSLIRAVAAAASPACPIFNGGTGVATPVAKVVGPIFDALGAGAPEFGGAGRPGDPRDYLADTSRARSLGWAPAVEFSRGLAGYLRWFQEQE